MATRSGGFGQPAARAYSSVADNAPGGAPNRETSMFRIFTVAALAAAFAASTTTAEPVARVKRAMGDVFVMVGGAEKRLNVGDFLTRDAVVTTGRRSGVGFTFFDNSRVSIGPNARVEIARYAFDPAAPSQKPTLEANLDQGVGAFVSGRVTERAPGAMQVRTPAALLGVRGTAFVAVTGQAIDK